jgi:hypothetical protein
MNSEAKAAGKPTSPTNLAIMACSSPVLSARQIVDSRPSNRDVKNSDQGIPVHGVLTMSVAGEREKKRLCKKILTG